MENKVILTYYDVNNNIAKESIWVEKKNDSEYWVKNIPFFAPNLAYNDLISVERDEDFLYFEDLIEPSEHSTIQIVMFDSNKIIDVVHKIEELQCSWEGMSEQTIIAVDIPPSVNYKELKEFLDNSSSQEILDYKEACLSETHLNNF